MLLQHNIAVFSVGVMFVGKAPCAGNGQSLGQPGNAADGRHASALRVDVMSVHKVSSKL